MSSAITRHWENDTFISAIFMSSAGKYSATFVFEEFLIFLMTILGQN